MLGKGAKMLPFIGTAIELGSMGYNLYKGDYKNAGFDLINAGVSFVPGGTLAKLGLVAASETARSYFTKDDNIKDAENKKAMTSSFVNSTNYMSSQNAQSTSNSNSVVQNYNTTIINGVGNDSQQMRNFLTGTD